MFLGWYNFSENLYKIGAEMPNQSSQSIPSENIYITNNLPAKLSNGIKHLVEKKIITFEKIER